MRKAKRKSRELVPPPGSPLGIHPADVLALRPQTERALQVSDPEALELAQGLRRGSSGELWSAIEAAEALAGARTTRELLAVTKELLPIQLEPGAAGLASIDKPKTVQQLLREHPPDNATPGEPFEP